MSNKMMFSDKLNKVGDSFNVYMYDNGFMMELSGKNKDDNWVTTKIICSTVEELIELLKDVTSMEREQ